MQWSSSIGQYQTEETFTLVNKMFGTIKIETKTLKNQDTSNCRAWKIISIDCTTFASQSHLPPYQIFCYVINYVPSSCQEKSQLTLTKPQLDNLPFSRDRTTRLGPIWIVYTDYAHPVIYENDPPKTQNISGSNYKFFGIHDRTFHT